MSLTTLPRLFVATVLAGITATGGGPAEGLLPWTPRADGWRTDAAWYDGRAERCVYEATRTIYGEPRTYLATAYTNKQRMDPRTTVKATGDGVEVFKHHWSERVPTENYDYDFSTAVFLRTSDLSPFKLTAATQDDCGASFKQISNEDGRVRYLESVYFPGAGVREGTLDGASHWADALPLVLRDFPFDEGVGTALTIDLLPSQKSARSVPFEAEACRVTLAGHESVSLPVGDVEAHRLELRAPDGMLRATYWFAAEAEAPWLHALVRYRDAAGDGYRLRSIERTAYWERG